MPLEHDSGIQELPLLLRDLLSAQADLREEARRRIRALPPEEMVRLFRITRKKVRRNNRAIGFFGIPLATLMVVLLTLGVAKIQEAFLPLGFGGMIGAAIVICTLFDHQRRARQALQTLFNDITEPRFLPVILDELAQVDLVPTTRRELTVVLLKMLPAARMEHAKNLTRRQRKALHEPLHHPTIHVDLTLATLKALEQIGDESALPLVKELAHKRSEVLNPYQDTADRICIAARACLPFLEARIEQAHQAQTLLRASAYGGSSDSLLRPAAPSQSVDETLLLRPSE